MQEIQSTIPKPASQKKQGGEENRRKIKIPYGIYTIFFFQNMQAWIISKSLEIQIKALILGKTLHSLFL